MDFHEIPASLVSPKIDFETWQQFIVVADSGGFMPASRILKIDSSAISRRINQLEETLELQLFYVDNKGLFLTTAGQNVLKQIRPVIEDITQLISSTAETRPILTSSVNIGISEDLNSSLLTDSLTELEYLNPGSNIVLELADKHREADAALDFMIVLKKEVSAGEVEIGEVRTVNLATESYLLRFGVPQEPEDLLNHSVVEPHHADSLTRLAFHGKARKTVIPNPPHTDCRSVSLTLRTAADDAGIALLIPSISRLPSSPGSAKFVKVMPDWQSEPLKLILRTNGKLKSSLKEKVLIEHLREFLTHQSGM